jgi:hypothetical protein
VAASTLHVVFDPSAAGGLRQALTQAGRDDRVISLFDSLSFGPINPPDSKLRGRWVEEKLGYTGWAEAVGDTASFWREASSISDRKVAWMSRRSAQEYAGFLEWIWRLGEDQIEIVDLTEVVVAGPTGEPYPAISLAMLSPDKILENGMLDRTETLTPGLRDQYRELWGKLRTENAPLRILDADTLVSAPLSFFDPLLLSCATPEWKKAARVVGEALADFFHTFILQTGDLVLCARVRALADTGYLEFRGDLFDIQNSEVRLPNAPVHAS